MTIVLGVSGGVAAYKAAELTRWFQQHGARVRVILTRAAREFVQPLTFSALTGEKAFTALFDAGHDASGGLGEGAIEHIAIAQWADALVIAPATAHTLARLAQGLADDLLTTVHLACPAPLIVAPAMNLEMWRHPATQANLETLRRRGAHIVDPEAGYLACGMVGAGRMAEPAVIGAVTLAQLQRRRDLAGETVLVTAGPTREPLDPVRYLSNRSSGKMGFALAEAAAARGARVVLVSGPVQLADPPGVETVRVSTAAEMAAAAETAFAGATIAILAAAVADYQAASIAPHKIKKTGARLELALTPTVDILARLGAAKQGQLLVGFAAETDPAQALANARRKREAKGADLIVLNDVSRDDIGFDRDENAATVVGPGGATRELPRTSKRRLADQILDEAMALRQAAVKA